MISKVYKHLEDYSKKLDHSSDTFQPIGEGIVNTRSKITSMCTKVMIKEGKSTRKKKKELYSNLVFNT